MYFHSIIWAELNFPISLAGASIVSISYGIRPKPENDPYIKIGEESLHAIATAADAGTYMVDVFPIRKSLVDMSGLRSNDPAYSEASAGMVPWCKVQARRGSVPKVDGRSSSYTVQLSQG